MSNYSRVIVTWCTLYADPADAQRLVEALTAADFPDRLRVAPVGDYDAPRGFEARMMIGGPKTDGMAFQATVLLEFNHLVVDDLLEFLREHFSDAEKRELQVFWKDEHMDRLRGAPLSVSALTFGHKTPGIERPTGFVYEVKSVATIELEANTVEERERALAKVKNGQVFMDRLEADDPTFVLVVPGNGVEASETPSREAADNELEHLRRWKREALEVMGKWDRAAALVDTPLGTSKSAAVCAELRRLQAFERKAGGAS